LVAKWFCDHTAWENLIKHIADNYWQEVLILTSSTVQEVNELASQMKREIKKKSKTSSENIKKFFFWLLEKTQYVTSAPYTPEAVRAFYCANEFDYISEVDQKIKEIVNHTRHLTNLLGIDIDEIQNNVLEPKGELNYDLSLDRALMMTTVLSFSIVRAENGKETGLTNYIERFNNTLRQRVSRLVRKTLSFSKSIENHVGAIWNFIHHYNAQLQIQASS
jgi:hypothetical protein